MRYQLWPLVVENGECNIPDQILENIWNQILVEGKMTKLFYSGHVADLEEWMKFIKNPVNHVILAVDTQENNICHVAWLNNLHDGLAWAHHCALGKMKREACELVVEYWKAFKNGNGDRLFEVLVGLTPENNEPAIRFLKMMGFTIVGTIPKACHTVYEGDGGKVGGVVSYCEF
jgi:hypothetical protein